jgi:hypothetical protein
MLKVNKNVGFPDFPDFSDFLDFLDCPDFPDFRICFIYGFVKGEAFPDIPGFMIFQIFSQIFYNR